MALSERYRQYLQLHVLYLLEIIAWHNTCLLYMKECFCPKSYIYYIVLLLSYSSLIEGIFQ